jgi:hypothetical protein
MAQAIAERLRSNPGLVAMARANLERWSKSCSVRGQSTLQEWRAVLDGPLEGVIALLTGENERASRLRQSNPFAGALPQSVRNEILLRFKAHDEAAT